MTRAFDFCSLYLVIAFLLIYCAMLLTVLTVLLLELIRLVARVAWRCRTTETTSFSPAEWTDDSDGDGDALVCVVCLSPLAAGELCRTLQCGHEDR